MKISRSKKPKTVLKYLIEAKECKTLYQISKETKIPYTSLELAVRNLLKKSLIEFDAEESQKRGRNATIYVPTFKGLLYYLATFKKKPEELIYVLKRTGDRLEYPLFRYARDLAVQWSHLNIIGYFREFAERLSAPPSEVNYYQWFLLQKSVHELEKKGLALERLESVKSLKWLGEDPKQALAKQTKYLKMQVEAYVNNIRKVEDQALRDGFCLAFLSRFGTYPKQLPIPELHNYIEQLLKRKTEEFNSTKSLLEAGLVLFGS